MYYLRAFPGDHKPFLGGIIVSLLRINQTKLRTAVLRSRIILLSVLILVLFVITGWMSTNDSNICR